MGANLGVHGLVGHLDCQAVGAHCLDMSRPLIDEDDVMACIGQIGGGATAIGARAENGDFIVH
jgi:hypothetical protein